MSLVKNCFRPVSSSGRRSFPSIQSGSNAAWHAGSLSAATAGSAGTSSGSTSVKTLGEEDVGLVEIGDGEWDVYFGPLRLGRFHERTLLIEDALGRHYRRRY